MLPRIALIAASLLACLAGAACEKTDTPTASTVESPHVTAALPAPSAMPVDTKSVCASPPPPGYHPEWCKQCPDQCQGTSGSAAPAPARHDKPLGDLVASASAVRVTASGAKQKTVDVRSAKDIAAIVDALGARQTSAEGQPRCLAPFAIVFLDGAGKTLAEIALCDSPGLAESNKPLGRLEEPKDQAGGFTVANLGALRSALAPLGIDLP